MHRKLKNFREKFTGLKNLTPQAEDKEDFLKKVLNDAKDLFNDLYYIYKDKYNKKINSLNTEDRKKFNYKKLRLTDDFEYKPQNEEASQLPKWIKTIEKRFNEVLNTIIEAKNNGFKVNIDGKEITLDKVESLLKGEGSGKIYGHEFKKKYSNIVDDVEEILNRRKLTKNQVKMIEILSQLKEIFNPKDKKTDEQSDTTDMPELESEEAVEQKRNHQGKGFKILTPS